METSFLFNEIKPYFNYKQLVLTLAQGEATSNLILSNLI